jgi:taurine--2-oxoglutarate transaminase
MVEGAHTIAAIVLETVVGTNGILVPPDGYLEGVRQICDEHGIVLIADEVMAGFGRCGEWFAVDHWGVVPDLITFAKGVNSGYVPLGGVIISERIAKTFDDQSYLGGLTYSGHPLACAAAVASVHAFKDEAVLDKARDLGSEVLAPGLRALAARHPSIGDVRGLGVFWAIEFVRDRNTKQPLVPFNASGDDAVPMNEFTKSCIDNGLYPFVHDNRIHVVPPINTSQRDVRYGLDILDKVIGATTDKYYTGALAPSCS